MRSFPFTRFATLVALTAHGLLVGCGANVPSTLKIGLSEPLSGPSAARGQDLLNGMRLAAKELNSAGVKIAGKSVNIEIVAVDDKADKDAAVKAAQDLVDQKVVSVVGDLSSDITAATIPVYKNGDIPQLFTSSATDLVKQGDGNAFRLIANDSLQARAIVGYLDDSLKAQSVALVYEDSAFGDPIAKDVTAGLQKAGKTLQLSEATSNKATDFSALVARLKASPPGVLVAVLRDQQLVPLLQELQAAQLGSLPVVATGSAKTDRLLHAPVDAPALYLTSSIVDPNDSVQGKGFLKKFDDEYHAAPIWAAHYGYDAVYLLVDVIRHAQSTDPKAVRDALRTVDANAPVNGNLRFDDNGEQRFPMITIYQRRQGAWDPLMRSDKW